MKNKVRIMIKKFICTIFILLACIFTTACDKKPTAIILFNHNPITRENLYDISTIFQSDKRVYYIFMTDKPVESDFLRVRIYKRAGSPVSMPINLVYSNDFKLNKQEVYYYTDYIVMHETGDYFMAIYELDDMRKPLARTNFRIE